MEATAFTVSDMPRNIPESEKKVTVSARILPAVLTALERIAQDDDRKLAYVIEKAIREYVEKHEPSRKRKN
jgi:hypothetical protein